MNTIVYSYMSILLFILCINSPTLCEDQGDSEESFGEFLFYSLLGIDNTQPCEFCRGWSNADIGSVKECSQVTDLLWTSFLSGLLITFTAVPLFCRRKARSKSKSKCSVSSKKRNPGKVHPSVIENKTVICKIHENKCKRLVNPRSIWVGRRKPIANLNIKPKTVSESNLLVNSNCIRFLGKNKIYDLRNPDSIPNKVLEALLCLKIHCSFHPHDKIRVLGKKVYHQCDTQDERNETTPGKRQSTSLMEINGDTYRPKIANDGDVDIGDPQLCSTLIDDSTEGSDYHDLTEDLDPQSQTEREGMTVCSDDKSLRSWLHNIGQWTYYGVCANEKETYSGNSLNNSLLNTSLDVSDCIKSMTLYGNDNSSFYQLAAVVLVKIAFDKAKDLFTNRNQNNNIIQQTTVESCIPEDGESDSSWILFFSCFEEPKDL